MAIVWGAYVHASGGYGMRIGIETTMTAVTHASKSSTATYKVYTQNDGTWDPPDRQVIEFDGNYNLPEQYEFDNVGTSATNGDIIHRVTKTYTYVYGPNTYGTTALPQEADLVADVIHTRPLYYPHVEVHIPFPVRPYGTPAVPTAIGVSRVSDTNNKIIWVNHPTVGEPYTAVWLERYIYNYATWARIATLGATVAAYNDTGAIANRKYTYRVQADNTVGTSAYVQAGGAIYTSPAAPTVPVRTVTAGNQVLTWALAVGYTEYQTEVWRSDNDVWSLLTTLAAGVTTYTDTTASTAVRTKYKFRTKTTVNTPVLYSAYSADTTETSGIPSAPAAPTNLKPVTTTIDPTGNIVHTWTHNPTDGSLQTAFEVQYRHVGSGTWLTSTKITNGASTWTMPKNSVSKGNQVEWQVRTWGFDSGLASPWSASALWTTTPAIPLKYPMYLDVDTGNVEANSHVTLITEQTRRVATVSRTTATTTTTAAYNICTYTIPAALARTGKKFRITAGCNLIPDTAGMYTDLRIYVGVGAVTTGTYIGANYVDHRIASRSVGAAFVTEWTFDPVVAGGENISTINIAFVAVPGGGGSLVNQSVNRPAFLIIDEILEGSSTAGGGGGSGVPPGGTDNQVLTKKSDIDGDAGWEDSQGGGGSAVIEPTYSVSYRQGAAVSLVNNVVTQIPWDTLDFTDGGIAKDSAGVFTVPVAGFYQVNAKVGFAQNSAGYRRIRLLQNGTSAVPGYSIAVPSSGATTNVVLARTIKCAAGDTVQLQVDQSSGVTLDTINSTPYNSIDITKVPTLSPGGGGVVVERTIATRRGQAASVSVANMTAVMVPWDTALNDDGSIPFSAGVWTIPVTGWYEFDVQVSWAVADATGYRMARLLVNGSTQATGAEPGSASVGTNSILVTSLLLYAGDTVQINTQQSSGVVTTVSPGTQYTYASITKVPQAYAGSAVSTYGERNYSATRRHTAGTSIVSGTWTPVPFDTELFSDGIPWDDPRLPGSQFYIPVDGFYHIEGGCQFLANGTGSRAVAIHQNAGAIATGIAPSSASSSTGATVAATIKATAGQYITLRVYQNSGAGLTLGGAPGNWMSITKVPAPVVNGAAASGVWGVGPLAGLGLDDLVGQEVYIDSKGQLRTKPIGIPVNCAAEVKFGTYTGTTANAGSSITYASYTKIGKTVTYWGNGTTGSAIVANGALFLPPSAGVPVTGKYYLPPPGVVATTGGIPLGRAQMYGAALDRVIFIPITSTAYWDFPANASLTWNWTYEVV